MDNKGCSMSMNNIKDNKLEYAKIFSEGNEMLEKCLIKLWNNGIYTVGCCIGHLEKNSLPYIGFDLTSGNINNVFSLLNTVDKTNIGIGLTSYKNKFTCSIKGLKTDSKELFDNILNSIDKFYNNDNIYEKDFNYLKECDDYISIQYFYVDGKLERCHCVTDDEYMKEKFSKLFSFRKYPYCDKVLVFDFVKKGE